MDGRGAHAEDEHNTDQPNVGQIAGPENRHIQDQVSDGPAPIAVMMPITQAPKRSIPLGATASTAVTAKATVPAKPIQ